MNNTCVGKYPGDVTYGKVFIRLRCAMLHSLHYTFLRKKYFDVIKPTHITYQVCQPYSLLCVVTHTTWSYVTLGKGDFIKPTTCRSYRT